MNLGIRGKHALVVGASRGIGRAIALAFAKEGVHVTGIARDAAALRVVGEEVASLGVDYRDVPCDLMVDGTPRRLAADLLGSRGAFDIVVHNVGGPMEVRDPLSPMTQWRRVWQYNAGIAIEMNELLIPPMIERGWGRVIHTSSISAVMLRGCPPYASAKAYLNAYTKTLGRALAAEGVVVSAVMPGAVAFEGSYWDEHLKNNPARCEDFLRHHQAVGRFGTPEEVAHWVVFLGSERATFAQAGLIPVDGGNM